MSSLEPSGTSSGSGQGRSARLVYRTTDIHRQYWYDYPSDAEDYNVPNPPDAYPKRGRPSDDRGVPGRRVYVERERYVDDFDQCDFCSKCPTHGTYNGVPVKQERTPPEDRRSYPLPDPLSDTHPPRAHPCPCRQCRDYHRAEAAKATAPPPPPPPVAGERRRRSSTKTNVKKSDVDMMQKIILAMGTNPITVAKWAVLTGFTLLGFAVACTYILHLPIPTSERILTI